jgi:myo-inositol-1(or 4)-monophosphatase
MIEIIDIENILKQAAVKSGRLLMDYFLHKQNIWNKSPYDVVTEADIASENVIVSEIKRHYPEHTILTEEKGIIEGDNKHTWIVDPLDGTLKFVLGDPYFSVSIAYEFNKNIEIAIVYKPYTQDTYIAYKGKGSFKNGIPLKVSLIGNLEQTFVCCDWGGSQAMQIQGLHYLSKLLPPRTRGVGINFSPALDLCNLAEGNISLMISNGTTVEDHAAGSLIVKEAGGVITNYGADSWSHRKQGIIASNTEKLKNIALDINKENDSW